ncbi:MAG TPA: TlpA family protein disulfide reductase [Bacteroidales bacterium]
MRLALLFITMSLFWQPKIGVVDTKVRTLNFDQLEPLLHRINDTVYLVNFWATWCGPCRAEMPAIKKVGEKYKASKFKVLLVSLDFPTQLNERLLPYIRTNHLKSEVVLLDDPNQNRWIDKVDPKWSGDLPFTLIYGRNFRETYARSFEFHELDSIINAKLKSL